MSLVFENVIQIAAPRSVVWCITVDIERWPQWTPTVTSLQRLDEGPLACGCAAMIQQPGLPKAKWVVTALIPDEQFTWESRILGMRMVATHELAAKETGTQSTLRVEISGLVAHLLSPLIRSSARRSLERENAALKATCESLSREWRGPPGHRPPQLPGRQSHHRNPSFPEG